MRNPRPLAYPARRTIVAAILGMVLLAAGSSPLLAAGDFDRYLQIRRARGGSLSPDASRVAFLTNITGVDQLWVVPAAGGWPEQLTFFKERVGQTLWSPRGDRIAFTLDEGGNERWQIYLVNPDGSDLLRLTEGDDVIHRLGGWSEDGRLLSYADNSRNRRFFDVYAMEIDGGGSRRVFESDAFNVAAGFSPSGRQLLVNRYTSNAENNLFVVDLESGDSQLITPHEGQARYKSPVWQRDESGLLLLSDRDRDFVNLAELSLKKPGKPELRFLGDGDWDVDGVRLSHDGRTVITTTNVDGYAEIAIRDRDGKSETETPPLSRGVPTVVDLSLDGKTMLVNLRTATEPGDLWTYRLDTGVVRRVTRSSLAGIAAESFVEPELVRYPGHEGLEIAAFLFRPTGSSAAGTLPVVVNVHGGPESQARPTFSSITQYLVSRGFAVLRPNVRGSTGYGKKYRDSDNARKRLDAVADLAAVVPWLVESGIAEPGRVAVMGGSYGGYMTLAALAFHPDLWAAGVDIVGIASFKTFLQHTSAWRRPLRAAEYGDPVKDSEFLDKASPLLHADAIRAPLMVIQGANDPRVPRSESDQIVESIRNRGGTVQYLLYENEGHGLSKLENRLDAYPKMVEFLARHLGVAEVSSVAGDTSRPSNE